MSGSAPKGGGTKFLEGIAEKVVKENGASRLQWWIMVSLWGVVVLAGGAWMAYITSRVDGIHVNRTDIGVLSARVATLEKEDPQLDWLKDRIDRVELKLDGIRDRISDLQKKIDQR